MEEKNEPEEQPKQEYVAELIDESEAAADPDSGEAAFVEPVIVEEVTDELTLSPAAPVYSPAVAPKSRPQQQSALAKPPEVLENLAAKGGAVGAIVLGTLALLGSFITSYAILNAVIGLLMGVWGLNSSHQRMAGVGMVLCLISAFFCAVEISSWLGSAG